MQAEIRGSSISVAAPVFLADMDHVTSRLRLHVRRGINESEVRSRAQAALDAAGQPVEVVVRSHDLSQLAYPRSLENWLDRFQLGEVIHDPTMIVSRARALLLAAKACRDAMGAQARGVYFDPSRRTLLVLIRGGKDGAKPATRDWVRSLVDEAWASSDSAESVAKVSVQAVVSLPRGELVPVDAASASMGRRISSSIRRWLAPLALLLAAGAIAGPAAAKTDGRQPAFTSRAQQPAMTAEYGVLFGLSVFAEGQRRHDMDQFASTGLKRFFGYTAKGVPGIRVAQGNVRRNVQLLYDIDTGSQTGNEPGPRRADLSDVDTGTANGNPGS